MLQDMITILSHQYEVNPGEYFNVETPWIKDITDVKTIIIDQDHVFTKMVSVYPRNFVIFLEQFPHYSLYRTNYPLEKIENSDSYRVVFPPEESN